MNDGRKDGFGFIVVFGMVVEKGTLSLEELGCGEDLGELVEGLVNIG